MNLASSAYTASSLQPFLSPEPHGPPLSMTLPSIVHDSVPLTDEIVREKGTYSILCYQMLGACRTVPAQKHAQFLNG